MGKSFETCNNQEEIKNKLKEWSKQENHNSFKQAIIHKAEIMWYIARIINNTNINDDNDNNNKEYDSINKKTSWSTATRSFKKSQRHLLKLL